MIYPNMHKQNLSSDLNSGYYDWNSAQSRHGKKSFYSVYVYDQKIFES